MKTGLAREVDKSGDGVFVGVFGENFFAGAKLKFAVADVNRFLKQAFRGESSAMVDTELAGDQTVSFSSS